MIITCKQCNTSFNLKESFVKPKGSKVQCSRCSNLFIVYPPKPSRTADKSTALKVRPESKPQKAHQGLRISKEEEATAKLNKERLSEERKSEFEVDQKGGFDLSGIEKMLEMDEKPPGAEPEDLSSDFDSDAEKRAENAWNQMRRKSPDRKLRPATCSA